MADTTPIGAAANSVSASLTPEQFADLAPDKNYGSQSITADYKTNYDGKAETLSKIVDAFAKYCIAKHATDESAYQTLTADADGKLRIGEMASYGICFGIGENSARIYQTTVFNSMPFAGTGNDAGKWLIYSGYDLVMKSALPKVEKSVAGAGADKDAYVGQELTYTIKATVPVYKDFKPDAVDTNNPVLQIQDTLTTSLTMLSKASEVAVTDGTDALPNDSYTVTIVGKVLTVRFNYDNEKVRAASEVHVTYKAKINEYAVVGTAGNPNTVTYKYSNSPSVTSDWKTDPPTTGIGTQTDTEIVYTYGLQILKHEKDHTDIVLNNAEFKIYTTAACDGDSVGTFRTDSTVLPKTHKAPDSYINVSVDFGNSVGMIPLNSIVEKAEAYKPKQRITYKLIKEYILEKYSFKVHTAYIAEVKRDLGLPMYDAPNAVETLKQPRKHPTPIQVTAIKDALTYFQVI